MAQAARAIIIENGKLLIMYRNKQGAEYYTLVGGRVDDSETIIEGLVREVCEETGLHITKGSHVYTEDHREPYNKQYIYLCEVAPHADIAIQEYSEESQMNQVGVNIHQPMWVDSRAFERLPFRTPQLQAAIVKALKKGFPAGPVQI